MSSPEELRGLLLGCALLMALGLLLLLGLVRLLPGQPGPRWWALACLLALAAALLAEAAGRTGEAGLPGLMLLCGLLALACVAQGLLRFGGGPALAPGWLAVPVLLYLPIAWGVMSWTPPLQQALAASLAAALGWAGLAGLALVLARRGLGELHAGVAACCLLGAAGWLLRAGLLYRSGPRWRDELVLADSAALWISFVASGLLVLLLVLAVGLQLAGRLRRESALDALTGALNRRGFEQRTACLAALSARLGQSLVVLMLDIDHFRMINDWHGRAVGDLALKSLAQLVQRAKRESDAFARLGGEEFCIVLPGTDVPGARVFADRLRRSFAAFEIDTGRSFLSCTVSIGVAYASAATLQAGNVDLVDLLRQADEALYEAKRAGRNRVRFFASPEVRSSRLDSRLFASTTPSQEG